MQYCLGEAAEVYLGNQHESLDASGRVLPHQVSFMSISGSKRRLPGLGLD